MQHPAARHHGRLGPGPRRRVSDAGGDAPHERVGEPVRPERVAERGDQGPAGLGLGRGAEIRGAHPARHPLGGLAALLPRGDGFFHAIRVTGLGQQDRPVECGRVRVDGVGQLLVPGPGFADRILGAREDPIEAPFPDEPVAHGLAQVQLACHEPVQGVLRPVELSERRRVPEERAERQADVDRHDDGADDGDEDREAAAGCAGRRFLGEDRGVGLTHAAAARAPTWLARIVPVVGSRSGRIARGRRRGGARARSGRRAPRDATARPGRSARDRSARSPR